jgi:uncharacterized protein (DUF58 family)
LEGPAKVHCGLQKSCRLEVILIRPEGESPAELRFGLETPAELSWGSEPETIRLTRAAAHVLALEVRGLTRGRHSAGQVHVGTDSPLGLWEVRARFVPQIQICVHPDVTAERRAFAAAFLPRINSGLRLQRQLGRGREFEKLRDYQPGDGFDEVHWKATARRGKPVTKLLQVERTQEVHVLLDASRLSGRPLPGSDGIERPVIERQVTAALALAGLARRQGDRMGLIVYADHVLHTMSAGSSPAHFNACREILSSTVPRPVSPDPAELFTHVATRLRRRSLLIMLADLSDPVGAEQYVRHLPVLTRRHLVLVVQPRPAELAPALHGPVPKDDAGVVSSLAWHYEWQQVNQTLAAVHATGARPMLADGPNYVLELINRYMNLRREQAL